MVKYWYSEVVADSYKVLSDIKIRKPIEVFVKSDKSSTIDLVDFNGKSVTSVMSAKSYSYDPYISILGSNKEDANNFLKTKINDFLISLNYSRKSYIQQIDNSLRSVEVALGSIKNESTSTTSASDKILSLWKKSAISDTKKISLKDLELMVYVTNFQLDMSRGYASNLFTSRRTDYGSIFERRLIFSNCEINSRYPILLSEKKPGQKTIKYHKLFCFDPFCDESELMEFINHDYFKNSVFLTKSEAWREFYKRLSESREIVLNRFEEQINMLEQIRQEI